MPRTDGRRNAAIKDGSLPEKIQSVMEDLKPEAAYFGEIGGARGAYFVVDMDDASQIPPIAEPLFLGMGATVRIHPVMTPEDLQKAGPAVEQAAQKYGWGTARVNSPSGRDPLELQPFSGLKSAFAG